MEPRVAASTLFLRRNLQSDGEFCLCYGRLTTSARSINFKTVAFRWTVHLQEICNFAEDIPVRPRERGSKKS